jgi:tetratricopeptide (TPR) repeat protein
VPTIHNEAVQYKYDYNRIVHADEYILRHLAEHLHEAQQFERLYRLLVGNKAWMDAKFSRLGGDEEYVADLNLAMSNFIDPITNSQLLLLIQLRMARSVVNTRANAITDDDLKTLVFLGQEKKALSSVKLRPTADAQFNGFQSIWIALFKRGIYDPILLKDNFELAKHIHDPRKSEFALARIANAFSQAGDLENAFATLGCIDNLNVFLDTQVSIVSTLTQVGRTNDALRVVKNIHDTRTMGTALATVAASLFLKSNSRASVLLERAMNATRKLKRADRNFMLSEIAKVLARNGCIDQARSIIKGIRNPQTPDYRKYALIELACALARNKQFKEMRAILKKIDDATLFYPNLAAAITTGGDVDGALSLTRTLYEPLKSMALRDVVLILAETGEYDRLISIIPYIEDKSKLLSAIAVTLAVAGDTPRAEIVLKAALEENQLDYLIYSARLMRGDLAAALAVTGYFDLGVTLASSIKSRIGHSTLTETGLENTADTWTTRSEERTASLLTIVTVMTWTGQLDRAFETIKLIHGKYNKAEAYLQISEILALNGRFDQALSLAQGITFVDVRARALSKVGKALADVGDERAYKVLSRALNLALRSVIKRKTTLSVVVSAFQKRSNSRSKQVFEDTIGEVCDKLSAQKQAAALWDISSALAQVGDQRAVAVFDDMLTSIEQIGQQRRRLDLLRSIAEALALAGNCRAQAILLKVYKLEYGSDNSYLPDFMQSFFDSLSVAEDMLINSKVLFGKIPGEGADQFFEAKLNEIMENEDFYLKVCALKDVMIIAAIIGDRHAQKALELLVDLVIENRAVDDLKELISRLADAGSTFSSTLSYKLMKLEYSYDDQILPTNRLRSHWRLTTIAQKKLWVDTLRLLDLRNHPYELLGIFAEWTMIFEKTERGLTRIILNEALRVAGWLGESPYDIASLFIRHGKRLSAMG